MAEIPRNTYTPPTMSSQPPGPVVPSVASQLVPAPNKITGLLAGEQLFAGDACYIKNDGKVYRSTGAAANAAAAVDGFAAINAPVNEAATLLHGIVFQYPSTLAPGASVYLSGANPGGLADAASTGGTAVIGKVIDANRMYLKRSW
jgi:hypothetical protein